MTKNEIWLLGVSLFLGLIVLELGLRLLTPYPISAMSNIVVHEQLGHVLRPGKANIDERGFRNNKMEFVDVVALGDSHTFGFNAAPGDSWPSQLGKLTGKNVYNFGMGGYGLLQYHFLLDQAIDLKPDTIILGLYVANDLADVCLMMSRSEYWKTHAKKLGLDVHRCSEKEIQKYLQGTGNAQRFRLARWAKENIASVSLLYALITDFSDVQKINTDNAADAIVINDENVRTIINHRRIALHSRAMDLHSPDITMGYEFLKKFLMSARQKTNLHGIRFGVLMIPSKGFVFYRYLKERKHKIPKDYEEMIHREELLRNQIMTYLSGINVPVSDAMPEMVRMITTDGELYPKRDDGHPYAKGYAAYARASVLLLPAEQRSR